MFGKQACQLFQCLETYSDISIHDVSALPLQCWRWRAPTPRFTEQKHPAARGSVSCPTFGYSALLSRHTGIEMRRAQTIIESRWGALGSLILLQAYGLMLAYFFAGALRHIGSTTLYDAPGNSLEIAVGLMFMAVFVYAQGGLLREIISYLKDTRDFGGWIRDAASVQGILRVVITVAALALYVALLSGYTTLGFPQLSMVILLAYQVFHPVASRLVAKQMLKNQPPMETRYESTLYQVGSFAVCMVAATVFIGFSLLMKRDGEPAHWIILMMGSGVAVFALIGLMLEDIRGRNRVVFIDDEDLANN